MTSDKIKTWLELDSEQPALYLLVIIHSEINLLENYKANGKDTGMFPERLQL